MEEKLSPFHTAILVFMIQSGVVVFSLAQLEARYFGSNGYLASFIISLVVAFNIYLISVVYKLGNGASVFVIFEKSVPRLLLFPLYFGLAAVWTMMGCLVTKQYVLIFQMIAFPTTNPMLFKLVVDLLALSLVSKGIYNISKAATILFWLIIWMLLLLTYFFADFEWNRFTPFLFKESHNMKEGAFQIYTAFLGYEFCLLLFPYANQKTKLTKAAYAGHFFTVFAYLSISIVSFGFFGYRLLKEMQFPLLDLLAYIKFPFIERIENLLYGFFLFTIIITCAVTIWAAKEALQRIFPKVNGNVLSCSIVFLAYFISFIPNVLSEVQAWLQYFAHFELGIAFGMPLALILLLLIQKRKDGISGE